MIASNNLVPLGTVAFLADGLGLLILALKEPKLARLTSQGLLEFAVGIGGLVIVFLRPVGAVWGTVIRVCWLLLLCLTLLRSLLLMRKRDLWRNVPALPNEAEGELIYLFATSLAVWILATLTGHWRLPCLAVAEWNFTLGISYVRGSCPGGIGLRLCKRLYKAVRIVSIGVWVLAIGTTFRWLVNPP